MKKISGLVLMAFITAVISGCTLFQNPSTSATTPINTTAVEPQSVITTPVTTSVTTPATIPATVPQTTAVSADPSTTSATVAPLATTPQTKPPATKPPATKPPATKPPATKPPATKPPATKPPISSNLPQSIKTALDKSDNGIVLIYQPLKYPDIVAVTGWNVEKFETNSQLFLVTKKTGSLVQVYDTKLTADEQDTVINDVIRHWTTTADYEVIRIRHSDPEIMLMNYIKVTEPGGKKTLTQIKSSMVGLPDWEAIEYD